MRGLHAAGYKPTVFLWGIPKVRIRDARRARGRIPRRRLVVIATSCLQEQ